MLIGNYSVLNKGPGRAFGGSTTSAEVTVPSNWQKSGPARNSMYVSGATTALVLYAIPSGNYAGKTWQLPQKTGELQSRFDAVATMTGTASGALGVNLTASAPVVFSVANAGLQLVVSATGTATVTFSTSSALAGALDAAGAASFAFTLPSTTLGAIISAQAAASFALSGAATPRALGNLAGDITPFTELSPQNLAAAVWGALATAINEPGTAGAALLAAGSAGDPWGTPLPGAYAAGSAGALVGELFNGLTTAQATQLREVFQRLGLDPAAPMTTGTTSVTFDGKTIDITEAGGSVTLTRQP